jgi:hypothetical protein
MFGIKLAVIGKMLPQYFKIIVLQLENSQLDLGFLEKVK